LGLEFVHKPDGSLTAILNNEKKFRGYHNRLHGGIISVLFDAAMTHCLFAKGFSGVTASLTINFQQSVDPNLPVEVNCHITKSKSRLFLLEGYLKQDDKVKCTANAKFWRLALNEE
jgi:acyl-coenzyme A thioesterase PaaI-like protein